MTTVMRFAISCDGTVVLGKMLKETPGLRPGHVYSVQEFLGEYVINDEGKSCLELAREDSVGTTSCWGQSVGMIVEKGDHLLTADESMARARILASKGVA